MEAEFATYRSKRMLVIFTTDVVVLAEIFVGMYLAAHNQVDLTAVFVKSFFSMFLPTVAVAIVALRLLRSRYGKAIQAHAEATPDSEDEGGLVV